MVRHVWEVQIVQIWCVSYTVCPVLVLGQSSVPARFELRDRQRQHSAYNGSQLVALCSGAAAMCGGFLSPLSGGAIHSPLKRRSGVERGLGSSDHGLAPVQNGAHVPIDHGGGSHSGQQLVALPSGVDATSGERRGEFLFPHGGYVPSLPMRRSGARCGTGSWSVGEISGRLRSHGRLSGLCDGGRRSSRLLDKTWASLRAHLWSQLKSTVISLTIAGDRASSIRIAVCTKNDNPHVCSLRKRALFSLIAKNESKHIYKMYKETSQSRDVSVRMNLLQAGLLKERRQYNKASDIVRVTGAYTAHVHFQISRGLSHSCLGNHLNNQ